MSPIVETDFTPWASLAGGALIGLSAVMVMALFQLRASPGSPMAPLARCCRWGSRRAIAAGGWLSSLA